MDRRWVVWFLDFTQTDLSHVGEIRMARFGMGIHLLEAGVYAPDEPAFLEGIEGLTKEHLDFWVTHRGRYDLEAIQADLRPFFQPVMERVAALQAFIVDGYTGDGATPLDEYKTALIAEIEPVQSIRLVAAPEPEGGWRSAIPALSPLKAYKFPRDAAKKTIMKLFMEFSSVGEMLKWNLVKALEGIPVGVLRRCQECGKWFAHFHDREKLFCSRRCGTAFGVRRIRKRRKEE